MSADDRWIALIDESASRSVYRIGALVMRAGARRVLAADLDAVMARAEERYGIPASTELHGYEIFQGQGPWRALQPRQRIAVYGEALDAVGWHAISFVFESIDRAAYERKYGAPRQGFNEHEAALMYVLERINEQAVAANQAAFVFADDCRFARDVTRSLQDFKLAGTWGYRSSRLDRILQIEFVDSKKYRQIQAVDLVTYLKHRIASGNDAGNHRAEVANAQLWSKVEAKVARDRLWTP